MQERKCETVRHAAKTITGLFFIVVFSVLATVSCRLFLGSDPNGAGDLRTEHIGMLQSLGLDTDLGPVTDPDGNPVSGDYNPLGRKRGVFHPLEEIYFAGFDHSGKTQYLVDDYQASLTNLYTSGDDSWAASQYKNCIGADVDGDGFEEIVVVYFAGSTPNGTLNLKVIDKDNGFYSEYNKVVVSGIESLPLYPQYQPGLASGDLDNDGKDEIVMSFSYYAYVFDDEGHDYARTSKNYSSSSTLYVAAGDVDGDAQDEFIVTYHIGSTAYCDLFDGSFSAVFDNRQAHPLVVSTVGQTFAQRVHVAMGDIDGDGFNEIVFHGQAQDGGPGWFLTAMDDARSSFAWLDFFTWTDNSEVLWWGGFSAALAILDYNGDGIDDIFASIGLMDYKVGSNSGHFCSPTNTNIEWIYTIFDNPPANVWTGDVDGDTDDPRKDELVWLWGDRLWIGGQNALGNYAQQQPLSGGCNGYSTLCLANVDDDTPIIEYTGDHELLFTDPTVIAVLACPPYHSGCGQNIGSCGTTFGKSTAQGVEETESTGFSVGFSIGYEYEDPFGASKVSFKLTVEESLDWISSQSSEIEKYIAYSSGPGEDKVIFTAIPFDVYYYTVISSPDPSEVGNPMTINIPREMQTLSVSRGFYNSNNGDHPDVDNQVLQHTIGDILSYPSLSKRTTLLSGEGLYSDLSPVGVGSGSITVGISTTVGQGTGTFSDFSVTVETEVGSGGITTGVSAGFHYGHGYTVTNTESTMYEGTVGDIPDENWDLDKNYSFGLFTYPASPASFDAKKFTVVNYWIE